MVERPGRDIHHLPPSSAEVKNEYSLWLRHMDRGSFTFYQYKFTSQYFLLKWTPPPLYVSSTDGHITVIFIAKSEPGTER
jgi:hypothetical protein